MNAKHRDLRRRFLTAVGLTLLVFVQLGLSDAADDKDAIPQGGTLTAGNTIYQVHVQDLRGSGVGLYTATTGPAHPAGSGLNVLFGDGDPGTTFNTIRSYTSGTDYPQTTDVGGVPLDPFGSVTPLGTTGFRTTYVLPGPPMTPDALTIIQDVNVHGTTFADSTIEVTTTVVNDGASPVQIGVRYLWDFQIGSDDGPTFQQLNPNGGVLINETEFLAPGFESYQMEDNDINPSPPTFDIRGTVVGPFGITPTPTAPDLLQYACWPFAFITTFDYTVNPTLDIATTASPCTVTGGDSAVNYFFGHDQAHAISIPGGGSHTVSASLLLTLAPQSTLSVVRVGLGSGTVTSSPVGINCGSTCSASFRSGTAVTLSATAAAGSTFASWSGCDTVLGAQCRLTLTSAKTVIATFEPLSTSVRLTITKAGTGSGVVTSPTGIACGAICTQVLTKGTVLTLTATPDTGSTFTGWSACSGTGSCTVTLTADTMVTATFSAPAGQFALAVALRGSASGTVTSNPSGLACPTSCAKLYASGTTVTLSASPGAGASFKGWVGGGCSGAGPCIVSMTAMRSVVAIFSAVFTDPDPTPATSIIRAVDITELRAAVNTLRAQNIGLASVTFTDPTIGVGSTVVKAVHFTELRTAVAEADVQAGVAPPSYIDPTLTPGASIIRAIDLNELRSALRRLE